MAVSVTQTLPLSAADRIYTPEGKRSLDREALQAAIDELARRGRITGQAVGFEKKPLASSPFLSILFLFIVNYSLLILF